MADHPDLREDLEAYFACHDEVQRLAGPLCDATHKGPGSDLGLLGDFQLLREVGRGGMGVVYEAVQVSLNRRVALKVLPFAAALDPRQLQRFKNEALAAAHLRHENIVPVHAVGCERGVHFYVMPFIDGRSLAAVIAELRQPEAGPSDDPAGLVASLSRDRSAGHCRYFDWVARTGRQAALSLDHSHQAGIVHRDVKPANLLLDLEGQVWVTDFGLARVASDTNLTATGEMLGTLRYASPEQALAGRGVVDQRSDVYGLGATLYELLALRPLFEGRDRNELLRLIADEEPPPPRAAFAAIPRELETIILKALRKAAWDRYATARELADDLQNFLDRRPVLARRPGPGEHLRRWGRRHPAVVTAGVVALVLLCAASLVGAALIRAEQQRTRAEQLRAEAAYLRERQRAEEAEARFRLARRSVDELVQASEEELADRPGLEALRTRLLSAALACYRELVEQRRDDPDAQAQLRETTSRVEKLVADLAVLRAAGQLYLLAQPAVLDDLRLDERQRGKMKGLTDRAGKWWVESMSTFGRLPPAERGRRALEQARANEAEVNTILTPAQQGRLRQLGLQSRGAAAFREPEVVKALALTPAQRERIRAIEEEEMFSWARPRDGATKGRPAAARILEVLTQEQAGRWRGMVGEAAKGRLMPFSGPAG